MLKKFILWFIAAFILITIQEGFFSKSADTYIETKKNITLATSNIATSTPTVVTRVVDGDTIVVNLDGKNEYVRLIGVDTPETVDPRKPVECFGKEASDFAKAELTNKHITLESDSSQGNRDKYGRLLRYVYLDDGTLVNKLLIAEGYGYEYTYNTPYNYQKEFRQAQATAKGLKKGLWADEVCSAFK